MEHSFSQLMLMEAELREIEHETCEERPVQSYSHS